ncbi:RidA family protein [Falsochrobactrum ovis]|uniref:Enamine deaminase RidA (YjgF/YER057c/UK114 family) n=1 Tax=Falsochrobactrum ovis TaxID=1293442 RepID=A0A364JY03_9HYPH|nr:RidA family protein [Falsochrobactrum ovis]RAK32336.1 enamine deaminase RidA (YjgF/YER057c/UK114 family) [Falsochrobactrum ovis]
MTDTIENRLERLGISLPEAAAPAANYLPYAQSGTLLLTSGQLPLVDGKLLSSGQIGDKLSVADGQAAARACAINVLAQAKAALGDLNKIKRIIKITVFVSSTANFIEQHLVANGASDILVDILGESGKHARSAVGVASLPLNASVEVEAIIEVA